MQKMFFEDAVDLLARYMDDRLDLQEEGEFVVKGRSYEVAAQRCAMVKGVVICFEEGEDGHAVNVKYGRGSRLRPARTVKSAVRAALCRWRALLLKMSPPSAN
jgi:hypothetical protein